MTRKNSEQGFTLIELMIAIVVIGVIAAIGIPSFAKYVRSARAATFVADIRTLANAADQYALESGWWVPDTDDGVYPTELEGYFSRRKFELGSTLGGQWDFEQFDLGEYASMVGVSNPDYGDDILKIVDSKIDDGNLNSGRFQDFGSGRYYYIIEE